jgi:hypothetical protein
MGRHHRPQTTSAIRTMREESGGRTPVSSPGYGQSRTRAQQIQLPPLEE